VNSGDATQERRLRVKTGRPGGVVVVFGVPSKRPLTSVLRTKALGSIGNAGGGMIIVRYADDLVRGFKQESDTHRFLDAL